MLESPSDNSNVSDNAEIFGQLKLVNVAEIEIIKEVLWEIKTQYADYKQIINLESVCALLLNHPNVPSLYVTSPKGYGKLYTKYQQDCQQYVVEELLTDAIEEVKNSPQLSNRNQNLAMFVNSTLNKIEDDYSQAINNKDNSSARSTDMAEILSSLSLTNIVEQAVIYEANSHIQCDYAASSHLIDLSDVCALVLNHKSIPTMYATNIEEYQQYRQTYFVEYQTQVRSIIRRTVSQIDVEGTEYSFIRNTMAKSNANQRNINSWNNLS